MNAWASLYQAQTAARALASPAWSGEIRKRLVALSEAGHCDPAVRGRFTYKNDGDLLKWSIYSGGEAAPVALRQLDDLESAELSVMALANRRNHLHQFTVLVEGRRADGSAWALAVHLEDDRVGDQKGTGASGHAAFHCHVGPSLDVAPKVRVPLPALGPVEALEWVLSQLVPNAEFEPAPWAEVQRALTGPSL